MSLIKRGNTWHISFTTPNGQRIRRSAKTEDKVKAKEFLDRLKAEYWRVQQVGDKPEMSWKNAVVRYTREASLKSEKDNVSIFRILDPFLGGLLLHQINNAVVQNIIDARMNEGVSNSTINRSLEKVRAVLNKAKDEWKVRCDPPKIRVLPEAKKRVRWITQLEAKRLLRELPSHLASIAEFALETGLRKTNITELEWSQVDLTRKVITIEVDQVLKSDRAFSIPLSYRAIELIRAQIGKNERFVFTFRNHKVSEVNTKAWRAALSRAGIANFRFHDLRHTWATWHVQRGTPLHILQELGNWSSFEMVKRYAHFSVEHLAEYVNGTNLTQTKKPLELAASE